MTTQMDELGWVPTFDEFGARLAAVRNKMGWNAKEAALACGIAQGSWREWEVRNRLPRDFAQAAEKIAERTGVDKYWLMTGQVTPTRPGPDDGAESPLSGLNRRPLAYMVSPLPAAMDNVRELRPHVPADAPIERRVAA